MLTYWYKIVKVTPKIWDFDGRVVSEQIATAVSKVFNEREVFPFMGITMHVSLDDNQNLGTNIELSVEQLKYLSRWFELTQIKSKDIHKQYVDKQLNELLQYSMKNNRYDIAEELLGCIKYINSNEG